MKAKASQKGMPMAPKLTDLLIQWRNEAAYPRDSDCVFASPYTEGKRPYWAEGAMQDHIQPAAKRAGITKRISWPTFRHSFGTIMKGNGEDVKAVQDLLRHVTSKVMLDVYTQADREAEEVRTQPGLRYLCCPVAGNGRLKPDKGHKLKNAFRASDGRHFYAFAPKSLYFLSVPFLCP
jgi:integrase